MVESSSPLELLLVIDTIDDATDSETDALTRDLLHQLRQDTSVESADLVPTQKPSGARAGDAVTIGMLALAVLPIYLERLIDELVAWSHRGEVKTIKFKKKTGDQEIEVEYTPQATVPRELPAELKDFISLLSAEANNK